jgi:hypothetical protein
VVECILQFIICFAQHPLLTGNYCLSSCRLIEKQGHVLLATVWQADAAHNSLFQAASTQRQQVNGGMASLSLTPLLA